MLSLLIDALIWPGRIDMQVYFSPITHKEAEQIFTRMYSKDFDDADKSELEPSVAPPLIFVVCSLDCGFSVQSTIGRVRIGFSIEVIYFLDVSLCWVSLYIPSGLR